MAPSFTDESPIRKNHALNSGSHVERRQQLFYNLNSTISPSQISNNYNHHPYQNNNNNNNNGVDNNYNRMNSQNNNYNNNHNYNNNGNGNGNNGGTGRGNNGNGVDMDHIYRFGYNNNNNNNYNNNKAPLSKFDGYEYDGGGSGIGGATTSTNHYNNNNNNLGNNLNSTEDPLSPPPHTLNIRGEEIGIVIMVLLLWIGAIILFFNRWGKIRMLEPYQPKFCENHRLSCPMADVTGMPHGPRTYSKYNLSTEVVSPHFAKCNYHGIGNVPSTNPGGVAVGVGGGGGISGSAGILGLGPGTSNIATGILNSNMAQHKLASRPRQNSVFVGCSSSPYSIITINGNPNTSNSASQYYNNSSISNISCSNQLKNTSSRKTKSAIDLSTLVLSDGFLENVRRNSKNSITHV